MIDVVHEFVDQAETVRLLRGVTLPLQENLGESGDDSEQAHRPDHAAPAGKETERHLGESDLHACGIQRDPMVGGECDLESAAQGGAADGRDDGPAQRLQPAEWFLDAVDVRHHRLGLSRAGLQDVVEVAAGEEGLLRGGDHHPGDGVALGGQAVDDLAQGHDEPLVHRVRGLGGVVENEGDDSIGVLLVPNCAVSHAVRFSCGQCWMRSTTVAMPMPAPTHRVARP
ncbi:hypothetical protein E143388_05504 [Rhodococcus opacus]|nr:hypothetical protein E143388_05504 [Rhodococcus opacus]